MGLFYARNKMNSNDGKIFELRGRYSKIKDYLVRIDRIVDHYVDQYEYNQVSEELIYQISKHVAKEIEITEINNRFQKAIRYEALIIREDIFWEIVMEEVERISDMRRAVSKPDIIPPNQPPGG